MNCSRPAKADDVVKLPFHFAAVHAEDGAVEKDVVPTGELGMKTSSHFEKTADPPPDPHQPRRWCCDSRDDFEQGRFSRAVGSDDCNGLPLLDFEGNVLQTPRNRPFPRARDPRARSRSWDFSRHSLHPPAVNVRKQLPAADLAEPVELGDVLN